MAAFFRPPIRRTRSGRYQVNLGPDERALVRNLAPQLKAALANPEAPGLRRLFPPAYAADADAAKQEEYARLMQDDLVERHGEALSVLERTADADELSAEELDAWGRAINDLRLVIGTNLDVSETDNSALAEVPEFHLYEVLGYLQECVIDALSRAD